MNLEENETSFKDSSQDSGSDSDLEIGKKFKISNANAGMSSSSAVPNECDSNSTGEDRAEEEESIPSQNDDNFSASQETHEDDEDFEDDEIEFDSENNFFDSLTPEELALAQKIFRTNLILREILNNLPVEKQFEFRLVNKFWEEESTSIILHESTPRLSLIFNWKTHGYDLSKQTVRNKLNKPLSELNSCISTSRRFPCSHLKIISPLNLESEDMTQFLDLQGQEIRTLVLDGVALGFPNSPNFLSCVRPTSLQNLLLEQAPNVRKLEIRGSESRQDETGTGTGDELQFSLLFPEKVTLPRLKSLHFAHYSSRISEIILAAPNLEKVSGDLFQAFDALNSMAKIHLVKTLSLCPSFARFPTLLQKWADAKPDPKLELEELQLWISYYANGSALNLKQPLSQLLTKNKESLKKMTLSLHENFFDGVIWPKFEHIKKLSVWNVVCNVQPFPPNFISSVFPNIEKLRVDTYGPDEYVDLNQLTFLVTDTPLQRLKLVKINDGYPQWFELLSRAAPNVEELLLTGTSCIFTCIEFISRLEKLKKLSLGSETIVLFVTDQFPQLDMAMTGLSEQMVRRLNEDPEYFEEMKMKVKMKEEEIPRVTPSILDCRALETLTLHFQTWPSPVSQEFGLKLLSQVNLTLTCTYRKIY